MKKYLASTSIIDWEHPEVHRTAKELAGSLNDTVEISRRCFEFVRDIIYHTSDYGMNPVTLKASEVLRHRTGFCFAKSHLLAALLRANSIPAGLCYQRIKRDDPEIPYCLHGLNAVRLPVLGWYRMDARGNKEGVDSRFTPPAEKLPFVAAGKGEYNLDGIYSDPLDVVVDVLARYTDYRDVLARLPDVPGDQRKP